MLKHEKISKLPKLYMM